MGNAVNQFFGCAISLENDVAGRHLPILVAERLDGDHTVIAGLFHGCQISLDVDGTAVDKLSVAVVNSAVVNDIAVVDVDSIQFIGRDFFNVRIIVGLSV